MAQTAKKPAIPLVEWGGRFEPSTAHRNQPFGRLQDLPAKQAHRHHAVGAADAAKACPRVDPVMTIDCLKHGCSGCCTQDPPVCRAARLEATQESA